MCIPCVFHAPRREGGLAITRLKYTIPMTRYRRLTRLNTDNDDILVQTLPTNKLARWTKPRTVDGIRILDKNDINRIHTNALTCSVDGSGLNNVSHCPNITKWINTAHPHYLDIAIRISRHDNVVKLLQKLLSESGATTITEPRIQTDRGSRIPDLITYKDSHCYSIDVSISSDCIDNDSAYNNKVEYYNIESIRNYARDVSTADTITVGACIFDWRGRPGNMTVGILKQMGLSKDDITLLSVKTLEGGVITYNNYKKS